MENPRMVYSLHLHYLKKNDIIFLYKYLIIIIDIYPFILVDSCPLTVTDFVFDLIFGVGNSIPLVYCHHLTQPPQFRLTIEFDFGPNRAHWNWYFAIKNNNWFPSKCNFTNTIYQGVSIDSVIVVPRFIPIYYASKWSHCLSLYQWLHFACLMCAIHGTPTHTHTHKSYTTILPLSVSVYYIHT